MLADPTGKPVTDSGEYVLYFNGRDAPLSRGGITRVGKARSRDLVTWQVDEEPVFADGPYAAQASVIRLDPGHYRLYYSFDTTRGFRLAESANGEDWRLLTEPLLRPAQLQCTRIGLPFVCQIGTDWLMFFEGFRDGRLRIFGARSIDGLGWEPTNGGEPLYHPPSDGWDALGQANPSLAWVGTSASRRAVLTFNGCSSPQRWELGYLVTNDPFTRDWEGPAARLLRLADGADWERGRLEGGRLVRASGGAWHLLYFGLPTSDSYARGAIGLADVAIEDVASPGAVVEAEARFNDGLAQRYFAIWDSYPIQRFTRKIENGWLADLVSPGESVLLIGSGGGRELEALLDRAGRIVALDVSPEMLRIGEERYAGRDVEWRVGDVQSPPEDLRGFHHAIGLGGVWCYLPDPERALRALRTALVPGGRLTLSVMNADHPSESRSDVVLTDGRVRRAYRSADLLDQLSRCGYVVETMRGHRFLVDLLPSDWNRKAERDPEMAAVLAAQLAVEDDLVGRIPPAMAKFLWVTAKVSEQTGDRAS